MLSVQFLVTALPLLHLGSAGSNGLRYRLVDLGPPVRDHLSGHRVNSFAWVTSFGPCFWRPTDGWARMPAYPGYEETACFDVSDMGSVAVEMLNNGHDDAGYWSQTSGLVKIDMPPGTGYRNTAAINEQGQVVGQSIDLVTERGRGWLFVPGQSTLDLGESPDGTATAAVDINDHGDIVGVHLELDVYWAAHLWSGANRTYKYLGRPPGMNFYPTAINNPGQVTAWTFPQGTPQLREPDGTWVYLGSLPGKLDFSGNAWDINDHGWVVGQGNYQGSGRAFLWRPGIGLSVLEDLVDESGKDWTFEIARGISKNGCITGAGKKPGDTMTRVFLLVPYLRPAAGG